LNRFNEGDLAFELATAGRPQPAAIAEIIQRARPEVLLINEFDYDAGGVAAARFQQNYLSIGQGGADPIEYPFRYVAPSNTGIDSGFDLNNDGFFGGPDDAFGFGFFPGQFGMVVYSMHPIDVDEIRTFQNFLWKDMPGALLPELPPGTPWFSPDELDVVRLSSKSHWDVPMWIGDRRCTSSSAIRRHRCSTVTRIATGGATATRSASGPTTCKVASRRRTSTTTPATSVG
jgi:hypothetical protein